MGNKLGCHITTEHWPLSTAWATHTHIATVICMCKKNCNCPMHAKQQNVYCFNGNCACKQRIANVTTQKMKLSKLYTKQWPIFFTFKHSVPCFCCKCPSHIYLWLRPPTMESLSLSAPSLSKFSAWMALAMVLMTCWWSLACASVTCTINLNLPLANFSCM